MQIWVDADSCPKAIKDILFRAANRTETLTTLVANQPLPISTVALYQNVARPIRLRCRR